MNLYRLPHCLSVISGLVPSYIGFGTVLHRVWYRLFDVYIGFGTVSLIFLIPSKGIRTGKRRAIPALFPLNTVNNNDFSLTEKEKTAYPRQGTAGGTMAYN